MKMAIKREDESRAREVLAEIGIVPVRSEKRRDGRLLSLVLPDLTEEQMALFEKEVPLELFAFRGHVIG